ncbi:MAG: hypothetical protein ACLFTB_08610 [Desulfovibrionales bacterium]
MSFPAEAVERLLYRDTTGDKEVVYSWSVEQHKEAVTIRVEKNDTTFVNECRVNGETLAWSKNSTDSEVKAYLDGGMLRVAGRSKGKELDRSVDLKGLPWLQPFSYSLPRIVSPGGETIVFWTIRPDTLEPVKLRAEFKGGQRLEINGEMVQAFKIRVTPPGALSMFWHGDYWYRDEDARFLRYEGRSGPPGAPMTMVTFLEEAQCKEKEKG